MLSTRTCPVRLHDISTVELCLHTSLKPYKFPKYRVLQIVYTYLKTVSALIDNDLCTERAKRHSQSTAFQTPCFWYFA